MKDSHALLKPSTYRLPDYQEAWLQAQAEKQGHTVKVYILRRLIDQAMKKEKA